MNQDVVKFIVFADARTGGTHLMSKLNSHPDIFAVSEPFAHHNLNTHAEQVAWMEEFYANQRKTKFEALGFRTKIEHQSDLDQFVNVVNNEKIICFSLQRRNLVKKAISRINAVALYKETNDYNRKSKDFKPKQYEVKPNKLVKEIEICEEQLRITSEFIGRLNNVNIIYYEQILLDEQGFFDGIIEKLGIEHKELKTTVFKNTGDDLSKSIINYDEIKERLSGTKYLGDLEEVLV